MKAIVVAIALTAGLVTTARVSAQEAPKPAEPTKEHEWLQRFVGEWEMEGEGTMGEGQAALKSKGTIRSRKLGAFWVISEMDMEMAGTKMNAVQTLGYDAKTKKYVGTWVDSMMDHMWKYDGTVDPEGKVLTLEAEGPSMTGEGKAKYRDVYDFKSKDHVLLTSQMLGGDGKWVTFMTANARRTK